MAIASDSDIRLRIPASDRVVRERLQARGINERFARQFRMGLFNLLRRSWIIPWVPYVFSRMRLRVTCRYRPT